MFRSLLCCLLLFTNTVVAQVIPKIIFDTDMTGDCDDCGSLAMLHALADNGEVEILGCIASYGGNPYVPGCIDAINTYYGRGDLPIGAIKEEYGRTFSRYLEPIATDQKRYGHDVVTKADVPDHVQVYRELLVNAPDGSVTIITVGRLKALYDLLVSPADEISDLDGKALVEKKVLRWVCMGGRYPNPEKKSEANFTTHGGKEYAKKVMDRWTLPAIFTGWKIGQAIQTGQTLVRDSDDNPVARAYRLFFTHPDNKKPMVSRASWDQTAILIAVRGTEPLWDVISEGHNDVGEDGVNVWRTSPDSNHSYIVKRQDPATVAALIESLMTQAPK